MVAMVLERSCLQKRVNGSMKLKKWLPVEDRLRGKKPEIKRISKMRRLLGRGLRNGYAVILDQAKIAAQRVRDKYEDTEPWSDFEWGMSGTCLIRK